MNSVFYGKKDFAHVIKWKVLKWWDSSVQVSCSVVSKSLWFTWTVAHQVSLSITNSQSLPKLMPSNHLILCTLLQPSIFPSIRVFLDESALCIRWPNYWSFSFNISSSHEHPGLISIRMDWLDLLAVQGTLSSLLQHHSSKASAFFVVQLSHPYMMWKTRKNHNFDYMDFYRQSRVSAF